MRLLLLTLFLILLLLLPVFRLVLLLLLLLLLFNELDDILFLDETLEPNMLLSLFVLFWFMVDVGVVSAPSIS